MSDHQDITIISPNSGNNNNKQQPINTTTTTSLPTRILLGLASGNSDHHGSSTSSITLTSSHQDNVLSTSSTSNTTTQHLHPVQISSSKLVSIPATTTSSGSPAVLKQLPQLVLKPVGSGGGHSNPVATSLLSSSTSAAGSTNQPNVLTIASGGHSGGQFQIPISIISAGKAGQVQMVAAGGGSGASTISLSSTNSSNSSNITGGSGTISAGSSPASATSSSTDASNDNEQGSQGQGQQQGSGNQQQQNGPFTRTVPIMDKGLTQCIRCGSVGMKDAFYGRNKSFCSNTCVRGIATTTTLTGQTVQAGPNQTQQPLFKIISMPYKSGTGEGGAQGQTQMLAMPIAIGSGGKGSIGSSSNTSGGASSLVLQGITPISSSGSTSSISTPILATSTTGNRLIIRQQPTTTPVQVGGGGGGKITTKQLPLRLSASANQAGSQVVVTSQSGSQTLYNISAQQFAILRAQMAQHSNQQQQQQQQQQEAAAAQAQQAANNQANSGKGNNSMKRSYSKVSIATAGGTKVQEVAVTPTTPSNSSAKRSKRNSTSSSGSNVSAASVGTSGSSANIVTSVTAKKSKGGSGKVSISTPTTNLNTTFSSASSSTSVSSPSVKSSTNSITIFNTSSSTPTSSSSGPLITTVKPSTGAVLTTSTPTGQHHQQQHQQQQQNSILINQLMRKPVTSSSSSTTSQSQQDGSTTTISTSGLIPLSTLATSGGGGGVTTSSSTTSAPTTNQFFVQFTGGTQGGKFISQQQLQMLMLKAQQQQAQAQAHAQQQAQQAATQQQQQNITIATTTTATTNQQQQQPIRTTYKSNTTTHAPATIAATSTTAATPTSNAAAATTTGSSNANENQYGNRLQHILNAQSNHHIQNQQAQVQQAHAQIAGATAQQQQPVATTLKLKPLTIAQMKQQSTVAATSQQQQQQITIKREIVQQTQQLQPVQLAAIVKTEPAQPVATLTATPPSVAPTPPAPPAPPSPPELTKEQEIKQLESAIKLALANNPTTAKNLYTSTPPVWWLILEKYGLDRCAPLTAFSHFPMRNEWSDYVNGPVCFEIKLLPDHHPNGSNGSVGHNYFVFSNANGNGGNGGNGGNHNLNNVTNSPGTPTTPTGTPNKSGGKKKNSELNGNFFWFVKIVANSGCYLRLRYVGLENNTSYDFWINFRLRNLFPVGYAKSKGHKMKLPPEVEQNALSTYQAALRSMLASCKNVRMDLHSRFVEQIQLGWMKTGLRLEAQDKTKSACYRPATVDQLIGDRIHVRYDGDPAVGVSTGNECDIQGLWTHLQSGQLRPIGWSQLVGHELFACEEFATKSLERALDGVRHHIKSGNRMANEWGVVTRTELFDDKNLFKEGMKLEAIDPFNQLAICVVTIRKVLRFGFLLLSIDNHLDDPKETAIFCAHCNSPYLLPAGFCKVKGIALQTPIGYHREFNWTDYCIYTESVIAPINIFPRQLESQSANQFTEGMLLEAVDLLEPNLICIAVVKRVVDHLVMLHFIGWGDNLDQWCDCRSPNIFPVGYCDLVQYPLQGPPGKDGGAATPTNKASRKGRSKRKSGSGSKALLNALEDGQPSLLRQKMEDDKRKVNSLIQKMLNSNTNPSFTNGNSSNDLMDDSDSEHSVSVDKETKEAKQNSIEEYNFTSNLDKISSVPQSTSENSLLFNNIDDLIDDTKKVNTDLVIQLHNRKRIHLGRKATYEDDDDFADTRAPPIETVMIDDDGLRAEFRFYNEGLEDEEFDADKSSRLVSSEDYSVVLNKTMYKEVDVNLRELTKVPAWTEYQVAKYLMMFGFDFVYNDVIRHKINGKRFLCLTETQAIKLTYSVASAKRLIAVVDKLKAKISSYLAQNSNSFNNRTTFGNSSNNSTISTAVTTASSALQQAQQQLQSIFKF